MYAPAVKLYQIRGLHQQLRQFRSDNLSTRASYKQRTGSARTCLCLLPDNSSLCDCGMQLGSRPITPFRIHELAHQRRCSRRKQLNVSASTSWVVDLFVEVDISLPEDCGANRYMDTEEP